MACQGAPAREGGRAAASRRGSPVVRRGLALLAVLAPAGPAAADFDISVARIAEGDLVVMGSVDEPDGEVALDDLFTARTDSRGRFTFRVVYHPATCIVELKARAQRRSVVVANCGQMGPAGPPGLVGPAGRDAANRVRPGRPDRRARPPPRERRRGRLPGGARLRPPTRARRAAAAPRGDRMTGSPQLPETSGVPVVDAGAAVRLS